MIRYTVRKLVASEREDNVTKYFEYVEGYCNSSDIKPTSGIANGSNLIETDTGNWYFFNESTKTWSKWRELKE